MSRPRKRRKRKPLGQIALQVLMAKRLNPLWQRTRDQGERIPAERPQIEPDRGERL